MAKFVDGKDKGKCAMSGKTFLGVPRKTVSSKSGSISKQDARGKDKASFNG